MFKDNPSHTSKNPHIKYFASLVMSVFLLLGFGFVMHSTFESKNNGKSFDILGSFPKTDLNQEIDHMRKISTMKTILSTSFNDPDHSEQFLTNNVGQKTQLITDQRYHNPIELRHMNTDAEEPCALSCNHLIFRGIGPNGHAYGVKQNNLNQNYRENENDTLFTF